MPGRPVRLPLRGQLRLARDPAAPVADSLIPVELRRPERAARAPTQPMLAQRGGVPVPLVAGQPTRWRPIRASHGPARSGWLADRAVHALEDVARLELQADRLEHQVGVAGTGDERNSSLEIAAMSRRSPSSRTTSGPRERGVGDPGPFRPCAEVQDAQAEVAADARRRRDQPTARGDNANQQTRCPHTELMPSNVAKSLTRSAARRPRPRRGRPGTTIRPPPWLRQV